ncbi:Na(+)-translocating NADH-quinone reductase subunit C [Aliidiomarina iranensis]|uniref:Na(+)-translocating NADH-quinone reductase subunit C n=1 Tax=Aliidiomarina iranensis TaxID=1434071 RepID=A0A432VWR0_9GAMM|nr:Na(+)-translocating NADH-quinone reductase subunit C [Aliidiomarina iranensis]RUO21099.1 Na(+)-translocating NADH-quinone reductase subunit C [Aliidiomarina iranensis]
MASKNDTISKTFTVIIALCLVCSIVVSGAAVGLKERQEANAALAKQGNILASAGIDFASQGAETVFAERVRVLSFNHETGEVTSYDSLVNMEAALAEASASPVQNNAGVRDMRSELPVFAIQGEGDDSVQSYVIDVRGAGLWGMMYGFVALSADGQTIQGLNFYDHSETPGLGGEIQNPRWAGRFEGKKAVDDNGNVAISVVKGAQADKNQVDALSGATITSNGVDNTFQFWLSDKAYGSFLATLREEGVI